MTSRLDHFPVITEVSVAWAEMDALQHVNNAVYFRYFEAARLEYFERIELTVNLTTSQVGPVLSETQCRYKLPITYPDTLFIGSRISELQEDRFTMEYQIVSKKLGKVSTLGKATCVMFDFKNNVKAQLPESLKQAIFDVENPA
ncbi:acyl-CoA thioesterase [Vibrio ostreicida]|uniref:Thioesterase family protein n=1 Tax=Vibrio ostreicida TaxID=526588 RepID=A0ABT8BY64_9VIBR|nr:thioesterase family protein [Vibrio ostreicida]MDN3612001.1 thioesterase family protein [Vibrio ostreicida]NPD08825.1 acyl-CoA thioesterase [Vibrio ostreicida]